MAALLDVLPKRRGGDDERAGCHESVAGIIRAKRKNRVVPAGKIALEQTAAGEMVRMIFVVNKRGDHLAVIAPQSGDESPPVIARRIGRLLRVENDAAVDLQMIEIGPAQDAIDEVKRA